MSGQNWLFDVQRKALAEALCFQIESVPGWTAKVWFKGSVCRVYVERGGGQAGYITIYETGDIRKSLQGDDGYHHELDHLFLTARDRARRG